MFSCNIQKNPTTINFNFSKKKNISHNKYKHKESKTSVARKIRENSVRAEEWFERDEIAKSPREQAS
jgi:hypothetical protein